MDKIFLHGMKAESLIGVYDWERNQQQTLLIDLDIGIEEKSALSDTIDDTVHYGNVCTVIRQNLKSQNFQLLEALAEYIAELILGQFNALWVRVKVVKPGILEQVREVGVEIERSKVC